MAVTPVVCPETLAAVPLPAGNVETVTVPAPAKLNLFLHVTGRRADGYHLLESLFCLVTLADTLRFMRLAAASGVVRTGDMAEAGEADLCERAARALEKKTGKNLDVEIHVTKRIPSGAGMGGGSSDAASTLITLNRLFALGLTRDELITIAVTLGADVPFFVFGQTAFARGIGEILTPVTTPAARVALAMPSVPTATAGIFGAPELKRDTPSVSVEALTSDIQAHWPRLFGHNDLEAVVLKRNPDVRRLIAAMGAGARMTGSGSAVFAAEVSKESALKHLKNLAAGDTGWTASVLARHPLYDWL